MLASVIAQPGSKLLRNGASGGPGESYPEGIAARKNIAKESVDRRRVFRGKFVGVLKSAFQHGQVHLSGDWALLAQPRIFANWLRPLFR